MPCCSTPSSLCLAQSLQPRYSSKAKIGNMLCHSWTGPGYPQEAQACGYNHSIHSLSATTRSPQRVQKMVCTAKIRVFDKRRGGLLTNMTKSQLSAAHESCDPSMQKGPPSPHTHTHAHMHTLALGIYFAVRGRTMKTSRSASTDSAMPR